MSLIVQKFGGTSVGSPERIEQIADKIASFRDDGHDRDLGYPSSVELNDGSIMTIYYQKLESVAEKCALLWSKWELPR